MSLESYAHRVVDLMVAKDSFPSFLQTLRDMNIAEESIDLAEAFIFVYFPYDIMAWSPHFGEQKQEFRSSMFARAAEWLKSASVRVVEDPHSFLATRIMEYSNILFEKGAGLQVKDEAALTRFSRIAYQHVTGDFTQDIAELYLISTHFTVELSARKSGEALKSFYDMYLECGDEQWVAAILSAIEKRKA
jgi:hypothetical protein